MSGMWGLPHKGMHTQCSVETRRPRLNPMRAPTSPEILTHLGLRGAHHFATEDVVLEGGGEAGGDDGHVNLALVLVVDDRTEDDVGCGVRKARHHFRHPGDSQHGIFSAPPPLKMVFRSFLHSMGCRCLWPWRRLYKESFGVTY